MKKRTGNAKRGAGIRFFLFLCAQKIGNRRVDADAETDTYGSDQILNRKTKESAVIAFSLIFATK